MRTSQGALPRLVGRYAVYDEISSGGMGSVNYGRLLGPVGFSRTVAIKRLHAQFVKDPEFVSMFIDEARLAARIRHPNVVQTTDVVALEDEIFLVMEFVQGESLSKLWRAASAKGGRIPPEVVSTVMVGVLHGLHAAHEATNERGELLHIVHRDVSPQNILVGADGVPRVIDFGIAKASGRAVSTRDGQLKGKLAYMAPEQLRSQPVDRRADIFAAGIVLWEMLTGKRLFAAESEGAVVTKVLELLVEPPSATSPDVPTEVDAIVQKALAREPAERFETAEAMALALEVALTMASNTRVARFVAELAGAALQKRAKAVAAIEESSDNRVRALDSAPTLDPSDVIDAEKTRSDTFVEAPVTQPSSMSVSGPALLAAAAPRPRIAAFVIAGALLVGILVAGFIGIRSLTDSRSVAAEPTSALPPLPTMAIPPPATSAPSSWASTSTDRPAGPIDPANEQPIASAPVGARPAPPSAGPRPRPAGVAGTPAPATSKPCTLHSFFDQAGIKHFEKQCP